jgi:protein subunit release factor B
MTAVVSPEKYAELVLRMERLGIFESDLTERFIRGGGRGGQKINKTSSCVYLSHGPSGVEVKCQSGRSQSFNRYLARRLLCERIEEIQEGKRSALEQAREKIRRQKRRRTRRQKERMLAGKRHRSATKVGRRPVRDNDA